MTGEKVVVTGSRGLIGSTVVPALIKKGYDVVEVDKVLGHDLSDEKFVSDFFKENPYPHLINLFGFNDHVDQSREASTVYNLPIESFRSSLDVNLTALFLVCREYAKFNHYGNIINFGASTGIVSARTDMYDGSHKHIGYSVSKAGVIHMTKILAVHLAPRIRVNCISPGGVEHNQQEEFKKKYGSNTPLKRMLDATEILPSIFMLLDSQNTYMTGSNIVIDGGWTII